MMNRKQTLTLGRKMSIFKKKVANLEKIEVNLMVLLVMILNVRLGCQRCTQYGICANPRSLRPRGPLQEKCTDVSVGNGPKIRVCMQIWMAHSPCRAIQHECDSNVCIYGPEAHV